MEINFRPSAHKAVFYTTELQFQFACLGKNTGCVTGCVFDVCAWTILLASML